jgi:hypothetical protein
MPTIDWSKEHITPDKFFELPREERFKIIIRHVPLKIKAPLFAIGVLGILTNCLVSAFAGTTVHNLILEAGNTEFTARFWSLALSLFSLQVLNSGMDKTSKWILDKLYGNGRKN